MALRLNHLRSVLTASCLLPLAAFASDTGTAAIAATPSAGWRTHVQISPGAGTVTHREHRPDVVLRVVNPSDGERISTTAKTGQFVRQVFGAASTTRFNKNFLNGTNVDAAPSPAIELMPAMLEKSLDRYFGAFPNAVPHGRATLRVEANEWALIYQDPKRGEQPYELRHFTMLRLLQPDGTAHQLLQCHDQGRSATLEQWQADDYVRLRAASRELAAACVQQFAAKMPLYFPQPLLPVQLLPADGSSIGTARVRVLNEATQRVTMHTNARCLTDHDATFNDPRWGVARNEAAADPDAQNLSLGIAETETLRSMKHPKYREYAVEAGQPLIFDAAIRLGGYFCSGKLASQFVPMPGEDYEVAMTTSGRVCKLNIHRVDADGSLLPVPARQAPEFCTRPDINYDTSSAQTRAQIRIDATPSAVDHRSDQPGM